MNTTKSGLASKSSVITRFAPSPTGFLHIGGVRTALFAYLFAKQNDGTFILRIEDTDKAREVEGSIAHIEESLRWLGIEWGYGPDKPGPWEFSSCLQSERLPLYKAYAEKLVEKGLAYPDPYTSEEVAAFREKAQAEKRPFLMRNHRPEEFEVWDGTKPLRFKVPEIKRYTWHDEVRGELSGGEEMLDDIIIIKADGYPTYNFAHIIDDHEMGVTHVMRGEEFIASTPKFLSLYDALEIERPAFVTLPPIMGPDGKKKLSKRDGSKDLLDYQKDGYLPEAMRNFLALIGWNPGGEQELFTGEELIQSFSLKKIQRSGGAFNEEKLKWMNKEYIATLTKEEQQDYVQTALPEKVTALRQYTTERIEKLTPVILERVHNKIEIAEAATAGEYDWSFSTPEYDVTLLKWKNDNSHTDCLPRLQKAQGLLANADFSSANSIKEALWSYAEEVGKGELLWPLRVALTGRERSPDPFTSAFILGKEETLTRLDAACGKISG
jgi:glutamyl-tRNA synthetase